VAPGQVGEGRVEERAQVVVGCIGRRGDARLAAAFLGEAGVAGVGDPDLHRAQARFAQGVTALSNPLLDRPDARRFNTPGKGLASRRGSWNFYGYLKLNGTMAVTASTN
jgi:hypothetical protein